MFDKKQHKCYYIEVLKRNKKSFSKKDLTKNDTNDKLNESKKRSSGVAVNMPACHAGDRGFDSRLDRHLNNGPLVKRFNTHAFHACIHGFESRTGHHKNFKKVFDRKS